MKTYKITFSFTREIKDYEIKQYFTRSVKDVDNPKKEELANIFLANIDATNAANLEVIESDPSEHDLEAIKRYGVKI